jgi:hypothetical protein
MDLSKLTTRQRAEVERRQRAHPELSPERIILEAVKGAHARITAATAPTTQQVRLDYAGISVTRAAIEQELQQARGRMGTILREMEDIATGAAGDQHGRSFTAPEQEIFDACVRGFELAAQRVEELVGRLRLDS